MHELAHFILRHTPSKVEVSPSGVLLLSDYSDEQELEADWLGAALLLPRAALFQLRKKGVTVQQMCTEYLVSEALCEWRLRMTGVDTQILRMRKSQRS